METLTAGGASMARKKPVRNNMPVRLSEEAIRLARIASGYTGESMADYISRIVAERASADVDSLHEKLKSESTTDVPTQSTAFKPKKAT